MIVAKFGGSSLATSSSISSVKEICKSIFAEQTGVVVVSALGGITDKLKECGLKAAAGQENYRKILKEIEERHIEVCRSLFPNNRQSSVLTKIKIHLNSSIIKKK